MMKKIFLCVVIFSGLPASAFLLISPSYKLSNPTNTIVNIAQGGCQANGVSNEELMNSINESINRYWNTVTESELKLYSGGEVARTTPVGGEILVSCTPMGSSGPSGVTYSSGGTARIVLNGTTFVPGGYLPGAMTGVLAHEMGHALGLDHSGDAASVMTYEAHEWRIVPAYLSQDDKDGVAYLYPREGKLGGLIPGCSAIAQDQRRYLSFSFWDYLVEILFIFGTLTLVSRSRRCFKI